ncbi:MAG: S1 RNA-binding domain-containing protein [Chloroflexi bacterium]|nr:S1 RNA-binding domain-containing protein [Chloroflexota bacterium]
MQEQNIDQYSQMSELPEDVLGPRTYQPGEAMEGEVVRIDQEGIVVSVGLKMEGVVPAEEMRSISAEELSGIKQGDKLLVTIVGGQGPGDMGLLSVDRVREHLWWQELQDAMEHGGMVTAKVTGHNRGGMEVEYRGIRGFVPFSHLAMDSGSADDNLLEQRIGQECQFDVIEVDQDQDRLILSERAIWRQRQEEARIQLFQQIEVGATMPGKVTSVRGFGAFVDIGGVQGLVHISELSWGNVSAPEDVVKAGDDIYVYVLAVDPENKRISLSLKRTLPEPWDTVPERYQIGEVVQGVVTKLAQFGAFVKLEEGVEGLVHLTELSPRHVTDPKECVYQGQSVKVMILTIDSEHRRISLSYKKAFGM